MKRLLALSLVPALLLTGCGMMTEELDVSPAAPVFAPVTEPDIAEPDNREPAETEPERRADAVPDGNALFGGITDAQALERLYSGEDNTVWIEGYSVPERGFYTVFVAPEGSDPVRALQQTEPNCRMETLEENELYGLYTFPELDEAPHLVPKVLGEVGNGYARYTGDMGEQSVLACFNLLAKDQKMLCRWYRDDPEIKCVIYDFIAVREVDPQTAVLGWYCYLIDRDDHLVNLNPEWNLEREIAVDPAQIPTAAAEPYDITETVTDIELSFEKTELVIGRDNPQIVVRAIPPAEFSPESVMLIDEDNGEVVSKLVDDCDYEAHGDNIQGDGWYCNRFTLETDFGTDPDVSEEKTFRYYAEFVENGIRHRSETVELTVMEQFTDKELDDMEHVSEAISALMGTDAWKAADTAARSDLAVELLQSLAEEGYVIPESIYANDGFVSYRHACGVGAGIQLKPFDKRYN